MANHSGYEPEDLNWKPETYRDPLDRDFNGPALDLTPRLASDPTAIPVKVEDVVTYCTVRGHIHWVEGTFADGSTRAI